MALRIRGPLLARATPDCTPDARATYGSSGWISAQTWHSSHGASRDRKGAGRSGDTLRPRVAAIDGPVTGPRAVRLRRIAPEYPRTCLAVGVVYAPIYGIASEASRTALRARRMDEPSWLRVFALGVGVTASRASRGCRWRPGVPADRLKSECLRARRRALRATSDVPREGRPPGRPLLQC